MRAVKTVARWLGLLLVVLMLAAGIGFLWYRSAVMPQVSGTLSAKGLAQPVEVVRDKEGVPHIFAQSEDDAAFAQGYVHAQDRLWQMEMNRRIANGRVAEILGEKALEIDRMLRTLGIRRSAEAIAAKMDPDAKAAFDAYARGVNAYLAARTSPLPPEFLLTGAPSPEPWTVVDSTGWMLMMALDLGGNLNSELLRLRLSQKGLTLKQIMELTPDPSGTPFAENLRDMGDIYRDVSRQAEAAQVLMTALPTYVEGMGSNNWVVSGARSETGKPLLANDPHLGLSAPALWYFVHLSAPGVNVIGASLPGVPGVVLGRNDRIAWGFTNTGPDVQDLFLEKIDPADPTRYITPDGPKAFEVVEERIRVKGREDEVLRVRISRHGPVLSDGASEAATTAVKPGYALALAWTALSPDNRTVHAARNMAKARNWDEFRTALKDFHAPQQNIVYADIDGNIGYIAPGRVPVRKADNDLYGLMPAPGWEARYDWDGFIPFDALPQVYNPPEGYRVTANERIVGPDYKPFLTHDWASPYRADRIKAMLNAQPKHSLRSFGAMQADVVSLHMRELLPVLTTARPASAQGEKAVALLKAWDGTLDANRAEGLIANSWVRELSRAIYGDELGAQLMATAFDQRPTFLAHVLGDWNGMARWCDDVATPKIETCADLLAPTLERALADLTTRYGAMEGWSWGQAHQARSEHRPFGKVGALRGLFDIRVPTPGDTFTVNVGRHSVRDEAEPFTSVHAASLRALYDLADPERSLYMHSTGQSGIALSPLYGNFAERWSRTDYIPMRMKRDSFDKDAMGTLRLVP